MARDMYGPMTGAAAWMMTTAWTWPHVLLLVAMWVVMMTAMMLPTAAPLDSALRDGRPQERGAGQPGTARVRARLGVPRGVGDLQHRAGGRAAASRLGVRAHPDDGTVVAGAFRLGLGHGTCLGCCWALMLILFAGDVMCVPSAPIIALQVAFM